VEKPLSTLAVATGKISTNLRCKYTIRSKYTIRLISSLLISSIKVPSGNPSLTEFVFDMFLG
jgi:hypothetical protein